MEINLGLLIKDFHDLQTHWNRKRDFTGRLTRISVQRSRGSRFDMISVNFDLLCAAWRRRTQEQEERKSQRQFVRVSVTDLVTGLSTREEVESRFFFLDLRF
jgi:hypothetical protein